MCINIWLNNNNTCPVCRREVQENLPNLQLPSRFPSRRRSAFSTSLSSELSSTSSTSSTMEPYTYRRARYTGVENHTISDIIRRRSEQRINSFARRFARS